MIRAVTLQRLCFLLFLASEFCAGLMVTHCIHARGRSPQLTSPHCRPLYSIAASWKDWTEKIREARSTAPLPHFREATVCLAKKRGGDGKKKPKKAKLEAVQDDQAENQEPTAARITNKNFGMSMKTQLKLVKAYKKMEERSSRTVMRTKFRKEKETTEEREARRRPERLQEMWSGTARPPVFLVDGYNVIGQWSKLKKKRDRGDMAAARDLLLEEVAQFAHYRGCQCTIVYDAAGNVLGPAGTASDTEKSGVEIVFVRDQSADDYIEARTAELQALKRAAGEGRAKARGEEGPAEVFICSSDNAIRSISAGHGARTMSGTMFVQELKRARKEFEGSLLDENHLSRAGSMVEDRIGEAAADKLYALMEAMEGREIRPRNTPDTDTDTSR
mmetsp:Transcript_12453/g.24083  ORF Transcript_12453/g.24083 Transcript_12453/m.24083 type:complete len:389 (-) Transcript_12453:80-1246(-)